MGFDFVAVRASSVRCGVLSDMDQYATTVHVLQESDNLFVRRLAFSRRPKCEESERTSGRDGTFFTCMCHLS